MCISSRTRCYPLSSVFFLDSRTAFLTHVITILICSISLRFPHEFILTQLAAGLVAIFSLRELSQRSQLFPDGFIGYTDLCSHLLRLRIDDRERSFHRLLEVEHTNVHLLHHQWNSVIIHLSFTLFIEKTFGFTSNVTLVELSNINNDLLRQMSETVPGTFQHSMQVANLAAEAAIRIGAKSQLVRTGALYHDIGKMENPAFFHRKSVRRS